MITRFQGGPLDGEHIETGDADAWEGVYAEPLSLKEAASLPSSWPGRSTQLKRVIYTRHCRKNPDRYGPLEYVFCLLGEEPW